DWESAELEGLPGLDLVYFLTYLSLFLAGAMGSGRFRAAYRACLEATTPMGRLIAECEARYAAAVGLDAGSLQALRLLTWLVHARSEYRRLWADAGGPPGRAALRSSLFVALWEE